MNHRKEINKQRERRARRTRRTIRSRRDLPRLAVFRSNKYVYGQLIDDERGVTMAAVRTVKQTSPKVATAWEIGKKMADLAGDLGVEEAVFDRGKYKYHGKVKAVAEGAREGGLKV